MASFLSALTRKRSICAQSTLCGLSFFMWVQERETLIVPDVFEESIFPGTARVEFFAREDRIIDFAPKLPLEFPHDFRHGFPARRADQEHIDVAGGILLVTGE